MEKDMDPGIRDDKSEKEKNIKADGPDRSDKDTENMKKKKETAEGSKVKDLKDEHESRTEEKEDESVRYMRLMADFQNYKKRVEKEKNDIYSYANEKIVTELLAVLDNFERALDAGNDAPESFLKGMELIFRQLYDVMEKAGTKEIEALGCDFDPNFHNAVMTEDSEEYESGKVTAVLQKGYMLNGRVIRPSMVKVAN